MQLRFFLSFFFFVFMAIAFCSCSSVEENYLLGIKHYSELDYDNAFYNFKISSELGNSQGKLMLGLMTLLGQGTSPDVEKGLELIKEASDSENPEAQFVYGLFNLSGSISAKDTERIFSEINDPFCLLLKDVQEKLQGKLPNNVNDGIALMQKSANTGYYKAQMVLADFFLKTNNPPESQRQYFYWIKLASKQDSKVATSMLGQCFLEGIGTDRDPHLAYQFLKKAADNNSSFAMLLIGNMYLHGDYVEKSVESAKQWYKKSSGLGRGEATRELALLLLDENGKDISQATDLLKIAISQGDGNAAYILGKKYCDSNDIGKAIDFFNQARSLDFYQASVSLGEIYYYGKGITPDFTKAFIYFSEAASHENAAGLFYLYLLHKNGHGCNLDRVKAMQYLQHAVKLGDSDAQNSLAICYQVGDGVTRDLQKAIDLYRKSADQGIAPTV